MMGSKLLSWNSDRCLAGNTNPLLEGVLLLQCENWLPNDILQEREERKKANIYYAYINY